MDRLMRVSLFVVVVVGFVVSSAAATAVCMPGSMASYAALGSDGCTDGRLTYSQFSYTGSTPATVAGIEPLGNGLHFGNGQDGWVGFEIGFRVVADPPIVGEALRLNGGARPGSPGFDGGPQNQTVSATFTPGGTLFTFAEASLSPGCYEPFLSACYPILSAQFEDSLSTVPTAQQDVVLEGFSSSLFRAPILGMDVVFNTPEPGSTVMLVAAVSIGLLARWWRARTGRMLNRRTRVCALRDR